MPRVAPQVEKGKCTCGPWRLTAQGTAVLPGGHAPSAERGHPGGGHSRYAGGVPHRAGSKSPGASSTSTWTSK